MRNTDDFLTGTERSLEQSGLLVRRPPVARMRSRPCAPSLYGDQQFMFDVPGRHRRKETAGRPTLCPKATRKERSGTPA